MAEHISAKVVYFSRLTQLEEGMIIKNNEILFRKEGKETRVCNLDQIALVGSCNVENVMAAAAMGICMGVPADVIEKTIVEFRAVAHRIEYVEEVNGVKFYNDSKGTNPDAAIQGIRAMVRPTVLLAGGYDKQSEYDEWIQECVGKVKAMVLIGATKEKIQKVAMQYNIPNIVLKETYEEALDTCVQLSQPGDAVLLSPACASWGMFDNYEQRGDLFKEYVRKLAEKNPS